MALSVDTSKVTLFGNMGGDIWNTGYWVDVDASLTPPAQADLDTWTTNVRTAWSTNFWTTTIRAMADPAVNYLGVRAHYYPAGSSVSTRTSESLVPSPTLGTGTQIHPYEVATVVTLRTVNASRRGRGRMYLPLSGVPMATGGLYSSGSIGAVADAAKASIDASNALATVGSITSTRAVVASQADGLVLPVTRITMDTKPDSQRRRQNKLVATLTSRTII